VEAGREILEIYKTDFAIESKEDRTPLTTADKRSHEVIAESGKTVRVHYTGTLFDGKKFDSSHDKGEPYQFVLGQGQVIKGWDEGIARMKEGGKAVLIVPSWLAYAKRGAGQDIGPDTPLRFDVELVEVVEE